MFMNFVDKVMLVSKDCTSIIMRDLLGVSDYVSHDTCEL